MTRLDALSRADIGFLIDSYGNTITLYQPSETYNDEGDPTYTLGTGTETTGLVMAIDQERMDFQPEGIDLQKSFRCYVKYDETIADDTIILYNSEYYKIYAKDPIEVSDTVCFYSMVISPTDIYTG